ncbi:MAG: hypothetical protein FJ293_04845 [Planctomycetes bacterium]|nr:hypothetical protein [Planctomycetota bacterium]
MIRTILAIALAHPPAPAPADEPHVVRDWLAIAPVDQRGRRPFNPSAIFAAHLLDRSAPTPQPGASLTGELGTPMSWQPVSAGAEGQVEGAFAAAAATIEWPRDEVVLARLTGAATLWVEGTPQVGDVYGDGVGGLPIALRKGTNRLLVTGIRGGFRLTITPAPAPLLLDPCDSTLPELVAGEPQPAWIGLVVMNASDEALPDVVLEWGERAGPDATAARPPFAPGRLREPCGLPPRGVLKLAFAPFPDDDHPAFAAPGRVELPVRVRAGGRTAATTLTLAVKSPLELRRETYRSGVDGSAQAFAVLPPTDGEASALLLTLHGAGVDCVGHAGSYSAKDDFWIVAPTNRRRFGFDWQDWGRRDALDVLDHFSSTREVDPARRFLAGHSMGGHGTWHLAANDPATFAAIAPSAGWSSFDSYGGRPPVAPPHAALAALWSAADGASRTLDLVPNLVQIPTYVLHGSADDNVPASEARALIAALTAAGAPPAAHFEEGAGHWWDGAASAGVDCLDWPAIFALFRRSRRPVPAADVDFLGLDPSTQATCEWVRVVELARYGEPFRVRGRFDPASRTVVVETGNVGRLQLMPPDGEPGILWRVDQQELPHELESGAVDLLRTADGWQPFDARSAARSGSGWTAARKESGQGWTQGGGPFKRAFDHEFILVHGTQGDDAEDRELLERARHDATHWWYRGNGRAPVMSDVRWLQLCAADVAGEFLTGVILYGNRDSNAAWGALVPEEAPFDAHRGALRLGERKFTGAALGACVVLPSPRLGQVGLMADSGALGTRLGHALLPFTSGVGYPDYALFDAGFLATGDGGVLAAGFFDAEWRLQEAR